MTLRKTARLIYLIVIAILLVITATSLLYSGDVHSIILGAIALISIVTSLVPYFISMYVFKKYEAEPENKAYKIFGIALYLCCYPIKLWVIYATIYEMLFGNHHWAFG